MALPAWWATIVHVPVATRVTVVPDTVHFPVVLLVKVTVRPEVAVALMPNVGVPDFECVPGFAKAMVCVTLLTVKLWFTDVAALYVVFPAWSAFTVHLPAASSVMVAPLVPPHVQMDGVVV